MALTGRRRVAAAVVCAAIAAGAAAAAPARDEATRRAVATRIARIEQVLAEKEPDAGARPLKMQVALEQARHHVDLAKKLLDRGNPEAGRAVADEAARFLARAGESAE